MSEVVLTPSEIMQGAMLGVMRQLQNMRDGRQPAYGAGQSNDWQLNIEGVLGEFALAKHLGIFYGGTGVFRGTDVGGVDVRTTTYENGRLILHKEDDDSRRYYLLTGMHGRYTVRGWILGSDGKRDEFWSDPAKGRPAYFVPQEALNHA